MPKGVNKKLLFPGVEILLEGIGGMVLSHMCEVLWLTLIVQIKAKQL